MNYDTEKFQKWAAKGHWSNWERRPEQTEDLRFLVTKALERMGIDETIGTTQLVDRILPDLNDVGRTYITLGLNYLRKHEMLEGYFVRGPKNPRTFGNPSIIWVNPLRLAGGAEGLEDVL